MEARDASGTVVAKEHAELITGGRWMVPTFGILTILAFAGIGFSTSILFGAAAMALIVFCAVVGVVSIASLGFWFWGRYLGFSWHFTK